MMARAGHDVSGILRDIGDGVTKWSVGDAVYGRLSDGHIGAWRHPARSSGDASDRLMRAV